MSSTTSTSNISTQGTNTGNFAVNNYVIPAIGSVGTFIVSSPYNTLVNQNINYTCMAIRTIGELVADNKNAYDLAYGPAGITQTVYDQALAENMPIIFLVTDGGNWVYIPANYIEQIPTVSGINYINVGINIVLGLMNQEYDFSNLTDQLAALTQTITGITPNTQVVQLSNSLQITIDQANQIETARQALITNNDSIYGLYLTTLNNLNAATQQIQALEQYIIANADILNISPTIGTANNP